MLMDRRDKERKIGAVADYPPIGAIRLEVILQDYAKHLMTEGLSEESIEEARESFDHDIRDMELTDWDGELLLDYFEARTGLLIQPAEGMVRLKLFYWGWKVKRRKMWIFLLCLHALRRLKMAAD